MAIKSSQQPNHTPAAIESARLQVTLLGVPEASWEGQPVPIARRQPRALLYRLAADLRPVPRSQLCYLFWPDIPDTTARRNLTRLIVLLRGALPSPALLVAEEEFVTLDRQQLWCDTVAATRLLATNDPPTRIATLTQAIDLYRGPFLDGFALPDCPEFEAWLERERRTWERSLFDTLAALIEAYTVARDYAAAIGVAHRYLQADELAEDVHRRLIALYAAQGDRAAALRQFERCAVILERELGVSPLPETRTVFEAVRDGKLLLPARPVDDTPAIVISAPSPQVEPGQSDAGLPAPTNPLIGRTTELAEVITLLRRREARLLTLSGPGGSGKTRLALAVAHGVATDFADGAVFVPLAPLREASHVLPAIMNALRLPDQGDQPPLVRLQTVLRNRELLLVLDNFEHVPAAAVEIAALLAAVPKLTVLATSRVLLQISGEHSHHVPPLVLADPAQLPPLDTLAQVEAVALFLARVRARLPAFRLTAANARDVAAICARLDGLPLAIELAAARAALLSPRMLLARLDRRLALLTDGPRDLPERQRTLRATIDWSYRLLDLGEQLLFGRLSVFADSWGVEAAESVVGAVGPLSIDTLDGLQALLDKHLLQRVEGSDGEARFAMLETIREYALERLAERGEAPAAQQAHAQSALALAEAAAPALHGPDQIPWFDRLDEEQANLRVALTWFLTAGDAVDALRLSGALYWFWHVRGHYAEGRTWLERALAAVPSSTGAIPPMLVAHAHFAVGQLAVDQQDALVAQRHCETSLALWRQLETEPQYHQQVQGPLVLAMGRVLQSRGQQDEHSLSAAYASEIQARVAAMADPWFTAYEAFNHGSARLEHWGEIGFAQTQLHKAQQLFTELGDLYHLTYVFAQLGLIAMLQDQAAEAHRWYERALAAARQLKERSLEALALDKLGELARLAGDDPRAAECYTASLRIYRDLDSRLDIARLTHNLAYLALHAGDVGLARSHFIESLHPYRAAGQLRGQADALAGLAAAAAQTRVPSTTLLAARWWGAVATFHATERTPIWPANQREMRHYQAIARATIGSPAFDAAYAEGTRYDFAQPIAEALHL